MSKDLKIKGKRTNGETLYGAINDSFREVIPFEYEKIEKKGTCYLCSKVDSDYTSVYNERGELLLDYSEGYIFDKYIGGNFVKSYYSVIKDGKVGIVEVDTSIINDNISTFGYKLKRANNIKVVYDFGKSDRIEEFSTNEVLLEKDVSNPEYTGVEKGYFKLSENDFSIAIVEPCKDLRISYCEWEVSPRDYRKLVLVTGSRYSDKEGRYLSFLSQEIGGKCNEVVSNINGKCSLDYNHKVFLFKGETRIIEKIMRAYDDKTNKETIIGLCATPGTKLKEAFRVEADKFKVHGKNEAIMISKDRHSLIRWNISNADNGEFIFEKVIPYKNNYCKLEYVTDNVLIGTKPDMTVELIFIEKSKSINKKSLKYIFSDNYVKIKKHSVYYECIKKNGQIDVIRFDLQNTIANKQMITYSNGETASFYNEMLDEKISPYTMPQRINKELEKDIEDIEVVPYDKDDYILFRNADSTSIISWGKNVVHSESEKLVKVIENGIMHLYMDHRGKCIDEGCVLKHLDLSKYDIKDEDIKDAVVKDSDLTIYTKDGKVLHLFRLYMIETVFFLKDKELDPENTTCKYFKSLDLLAIKHNDEIRFFKGEDNNIKTNALVGRKYKNFDTTIGVRKEEDYITYTELINNVPYATISNIDWSNGNEMVSFRTKNMEIESAVHNNRCIISKVDEKTKEKRYGVMYLPSNKMVIDFEYTNITPLFNYDNNQYTFVCTEINGTSVELDEDGYVYEREQAHTRTNKK